MISKGFPLSGVVVKTPLTGEDVRENLWILTDSGRIEPSDPIAVTLRVPGWAAECTPTNIDIVKPLSPQTRQILKEFPVKNHRIAKF
jgi:hypothetical protein